MSFTYTDTLTTDLGKVRFCIGDTVTAYAIFTDEEIGAALDKNGDDWYRAAGALLQIMAHAPGPLLSVHDASGRTFRMSGLSSTFAKFSDKWIGRG